VLSKGKAVPQHTYGGAGEEEVELLLIYDLGTRRVSGQRHAQAALYPREKDLRYPLDRRLDAGLDIND
jgi:hypothetical protein